MNPKILGFLAYIRVIWPRLLNQAPTLVTNATKLLNVQRLRAPSGFRATLHRIETSCPSEGKHKTRCTCVYIYIYIYIILYIYIYILRRHIPKMLVYILYFRYLCQFM